MKKFSILIVLIAVGFATYMWWPNISTLRNQAVEEPTSKLMSVESYVSQNISTLSPEKEVLGGTFYVTDIQVADGKGTVSYEDGHVAFTADFTYTSSDLTGHNITSFVIRD
ncbi:MAG: hypothetical protein ACYCY6_01780 [Minisyncoccota bacterium]